MKLQEKMFAMVEAWHQSGMTRQEFLTGKAVSKAKFDYWIKKHRLHHSRLEPKSPINSSTEAFKTFILTDEPRGSVSKSVSMEITTPSGIQITIYQ